MKPNEIFKRRKELQWKMIEDQAVLLDDAEGKVYRLDLTASEIWSRLDGEHSLAEIIGKLTQIFEVSPAQAQKDTFAFMSRLTGLDLVQKVGSA